MALEKDTSSAGWLRELTTAEIYKRSQGRIARQVTFGGLAVIVAAGCWSAHELLKLSSTLRAMVGWFGVEGRSADVAHQAAAYAIPLACLLGGLWIAFRAVNYPRFADFLIAVEAEMNKVSWPDSGTLFRSSVVVLVSIFFLAMILFGYDLFWNYILKLVGVA
jgi:preprotein translocase subunit SecE